MKRALLAVSALALVGCSDLAYNFNSDDLHNASAWEEANVSFGVAKKYEQLGISPETYSKFASVTITSPEEIKRISSIFPFPDGHMTVDYFKQSSFSQGLSIVLSGVKKGDFTLDEIAAFVKEAEKKNSSGEHEMSIMGMDPGSSFLLYPHILTSSARNIHRGQSVEDAVNRVIKLCRDQNAEHTGTTETSEKKRNREEFHRNNNDIPLTDVDIPY